MKYANHAYRTTGSTTILKIEERLVFILEHLIELRVKVLKKIIEVMGKINQEIKASTHLLLSTKHILSHRLHKGSINLIKLLLKSNPKLYSETIDS